MRILHAVHRYPPSTGGSEEVVARLSEGLAARGHEVHVATRAEPGRRPGGGVTVHGFGPGARGALAYRRLVRRGGWDVVMTYHSKVWTHLALWPFHRVGAPWVYAPVEFTDIGSRAPRHLAYYRTVEPASLARAAAVKVLTRRDATTARKLAPIPDERLHVIPNGVDHAYWAAPGRGSHAARAGAGVPADVPLAVYGGGYWPHKDVATLVEAVARTPRAHLVCTGPDHGTLEACRALAQARGVASRVHLLGVVPRDTLRDLMHAADLVVSASRKEGFGLVFLQGLAAGAPVAARDVGAVADLRADGAAISVCEDPGEFAGLMDDPPPRDAHGTTDVAARYDWARIVERMERLYAAVAR